MGADRGLAALGRARHAGRGALLTPPHRSWLGVRLVGGLLVLGAAAWASRRAPLVSLTLVVAATLVDGNLVFAIPVLGYLVGRRMERVARQSSSSPGSPSAGPC